MTNTNVSINTNKLQDQLRAISKHAEALADELEQIEMEECPDCGARGNKMTVHADDAPVYESYECPNCGCRYFGKGVSKHD